MKGIIQIIGGIFLAYSASGIILHLLANLEVFGHQCELLFLTTADNHLQIFTLTAAIAAVFFQIARKKKKRQVERRAG